MATRTSQQTEQKILALWGEMPNGSAIADEVGLSRSTVYRILRRNGISIDIEKSYRRRSRTTPEVDAEIVRRYQAGEGAGALATEYGFACHLSVIKRVREAGVEIRKPGPAFSDMPANVGAEILRLRDEEDATCETIARRLGISDARVSRWLRANGRGLWKSGRNPKYVGKVVGAGDGYRAVRVDADDPYVCMADGNGYVRQHRYVMAMALARPLARHESVHHINGDRADNRLENLQLRTGAHGKHVRFQCHDCGSHNVEAVPL